MQFERGKKIRLGLFILLGTVIFVAFFYLVGRSSQLFSKSLTIHTSFPSVSGLRTGDHVRFSGIIIGTISNLVITSETSVQVDMSIDRKMLEFIRKDSKVEIKPEALIGDKMVVIYSGSSEAAQVSEGDYLEPIESFHLDEILHQMSAELGEASDVILNLVDITEKANNGRGNIGQLLNDSSIVIKLDRSLDNVQSLTGNLRTFTRQLNNPKSDLGKLIYEDNLTTRMDSILVKLDNIATNTEIATRDLAKTTAELSISAEAINNGNGVVNKLLHDSTFADSIGVTIANLNQTLNEVKKVSTNLQHKRLFGGTKDKK